MSLVSERDRGRGHGHCQRENPVDKLVGASTSLAALTAWAVQCRPVAFLDFLAYAGRQAVGFLELHGFNIPPPYGINGADVRD